MVRLNLHIAVARTFGGRIADFGVSGYLGHGEAESPGVKEMVARLTTNRPAGAEEKETGAAFIFRDGLESAMENAAMARHFTLALAGRSQECRPLLAERLSLRGETKILDLRRRHGHL